MYLQPVDGKEEPDEAGQVGQPPGEQVHWPAAAQRPADVERRQDQQRHQGRRVEPHQQRRVKLPPFVPQHRLGPVVVVDVDVVVAAAAAAVVARPQLLVEKETQTLQRYQSEFSIDFNYMFDIKLTFHNFSTKYSIDLVSR